MNLTFALNFCSVAKFTGLLMKEVFIIYTIEIKDENQLYILREALATINAETNHQIHVIASVAKRLTDDELNEAKNLCAKRDYIEDLYQKTQNIIEQLNPEIYKKEES